MATSTILSNGSRYQGFTLLELIAALAIAGLVLAVAVPATARMYDSIRYRQAVREVVTTLASARHCAINSGMICDVEIMPRERTVRLQESSHQLPANISISVQSARELNRGDAGVIRFYPEGSASGGGVNLETDNGRGVRIGVDWLMGTVTQEPYGAD